MAGEKKRNCIRKQQEESKKIIVKLIPILTTIEDQQSISPTQTSFSPKALEQRIDPNETVKQPLENPWQRDPWPDHVRNKGIKDLPYENPKCCWELFNHMRDKRNAEKLRSYGLDKEIRPLTRDLKSPRDFSFLPPRAQNVKMVQFPECYDVGRDSDISSSDEEELPRRETSDCSGCSTLGKGFKRAPRPTKVYDYFEVDRKSPNPCEKIVENVMKSSRMGRLRPRNHTNL